MKKINVGKKLVLTSIVLILFSCRSVPEPSGLTPPQQLSDLDSNFINISGINIHYKDSGTSEPPLLMLHGFLGSLDGWSFISPELEKEHRVVAYDRLAFGLTERPGGTAENNPYTAENTEKRAMEFISALDIEKPVLIGHSAGGNLALRLALADPDSFSALVLISPAIYRNGPPAPVRFLLGLKIFEKTGLNTVRNLPADLDRFIEQAYYKPEEVSDQSIQDYLKPLGVENWDTALWEYTKAQGSSDITQRLEEIDLPVLIIHGREDQVVPVKYSIKAAKELPRSTVVILEECGHVAYEEKPLQTIQEIKKFLYSLNL